MTGVAFSLIGPLDVRCSGEPVVVRAGQQRSLLAALLVRANQPVSRQTLCLAIWGERLSDHAEVTLRSYIMRLRRALGPTVSDRLSLHPAGYLLRLEEDDELDLLRLQECVRRGRAAAQHQDWRRSLDAALSAGPDHVSAYALIVEEGTRLAAKVRRGEIPAPDDDVLADRYLIADDMLHAAGLAWYEVSNWAASDAARCQHNMLYWTGGHWWGFGPGAHSHVGGTRWWNVRHPSAYAARLAEGHSPAAAREILSPAERAMENIMLRLRLSDGLPLADLGAAAKPEAERHLAAGHLDPSAWTAGRLALTRAGRLLADAVIRDLT